MMHKLPKEICDMIYKRYIFTTEDLVDAINKNDLNAVKELCEMHKKYWQMDWNLGLKEAVHVGNIDMVELMVEKGAYDLATAFKIAANKKFQNTDPNKKYFDIAEYLHTIMWQEDSDEWDFMTYYSNF